MVLKVQEELHNLVRDNIIEVTFIEAAEKVYKDYCKLIIVVFLFDIIYIIKDGDSMLKLNNKLE